jgi:hypothetical protein
MKTWSELSARAGRNDMPGIMVDAFVAGQLEKDELAKAIADSWVMAEWPARQMTPESWIFLIDQVLDENSYLTDEGLILSKAAMKMPETLTLWRGCWPEFAEGLSWTLDRERAEWFAHRFDFGEHEGKGTLYEITIPYELVLAQFNGRNEDEYVIDSTMLMEDDIQEVS